MKPNLAIETFTNDDSGSPDLLLLGLKDIEFSTIEYSSAHYYKQISEDNKIGNVFGYGPEHTFFYKMSSYKDNELICYEKGLGYAYINDNKSYFKRYLPIIYGKNEQQAQPVQNNVLKFRFEENAINVITSEIPTNLTILMHDSNCTLVSFNQFAPCAIKTNEHSFLARVSDNNISSVSFNSKEFTDIVAEALCKYTKQIGFKSSKLNASKLAVKQLQLDSNDGSGAKAGTLIYDGENDTVKFYNGTKWRTLKWADEEKPE